MAGVDPDGVLLKGLVICMIGIVVLPFSHDSAAAPTPPAGHEHQRPGHCRMLPESQQPKAAVPPAGGAGATLVVMVPATTCNTSR